MSCQKLCRSLLLSAERTPTFHTEFNSTSCYLPISVSNKCTQLSSLICACARVRVRLLLLLLLLLGDRRSFLADDFKGFLFLFNPAGRGPSARRSSSTRGWASRTAARTPCSSPTNSTRARSSTAARRPSACGRTATPCSSASAPSRRSSCAGVGVACRGAPPRSQRLVRLRDAERVPDGHDAARPDPRDGQRRARALGGRAERRRARGRWVTV